MKRILAMVLLTAVLLTGCTQPEEEKPSYVLAYERAQALISEGQYSEAADVLKGLNGYEDSMVLGVYCRAKDALEKGEYALARAGFLSVEGFRDSRLAAGYAEACLMASSEDAGEVVMGAEMFDEIPLYLDSAERAASTRGMLYDRANSRLTQGEYDGAETDFLALAGYKDSARMAEYTNACRLESNGMDAPIQYLAAADAFEALSGFKDSARRAEAVIENIYASAGNALENGDGEKASELYSLLVYPKRFDPSLKARETYLDSLTMIDYSLIHVQAKKDTANEKIRAAEAFEALGEFRDSAEMAVSLREEVYAAAEKALSEKNYHRAALIFALQDYRDSRQMEEYAKAAQTGAKGDAESMLLAAEAFEALGEFRDSADRALEHRRGIYEAGLALLEKGDYENAITHFSCQDYEDSESLLVYAKAGGKGQASKEDPDGLLAAAEMFEGLGEYRDSASQAALLRKRVYEMAFEALEKKEFDSAVQLFSSQDYKDSGRMIEYVNAAKTASEGTPRSLIRSAEAFEKMDGFSDSAEKAEALRKEAYEMALSAIEENDFDTAIYILTLQNYGDSRKMIAYAGARKLEYTNKYDSLISAAGNYEKMSGFADSDARAKEIRRRVYEDANQALKNRSYDQAAYLFALQDYEDSAGMVEYVRAMKLEDSRNNESRIMAAAVYEKMNGFKDSEERAKNLRKSVYDEAQNALNAGSYDYSIRLFALQDYEDSLEMADYAGARKLESSKEYEDRVLAAKTYEKMSGFKDSDARAKSILSSMIGEAEAHAAEHRYEEADRIFLAMGDYGMGRERSGYLRCEEKLYLAQDDEAAMLEAAKAFEAMNGAFDSRERAQEIRNTVKNRAQAAMDEERYADAKALFALQDDEDSRILSAYAHALSIEFREGGDEADKIAAAKAFEEMGDVLDCKARAEALRSEVSVLAEKNFAEENFENAARLYALQADRDENGVLAGYCQARAAEKQAAENPEMWLEARKMYLKLSAHPESADRAEACLENAYLAAWKSYEDRAYASSVSLFEGLGDYKDSADAKVYAAAAKTLYEAGDNAKGYLEAISLYESISGYRDSASAVETINRQLFVRFVDDIGVFTKEGLARFEKNGRWGYLSTDGRVVVNAKYDMAYDFSEGYAAVKLGDKWGFIDAEGSIVIGMMYTDARSFSDGLAAVYDKNDGWHYIRPDGTVFRVKEYFSNGNFPGYYEDGYAFLGSEESSSAFVLNKYGTIVGRCYPLSFSEGISPVYLNKYSGNCAWNYITKDGKMLLKENVYSASAFRNGVAIVENKNHLYGLVGTDGQFISVPRWEDIQPASEGIFRVKKNGNYGYIDQNGKTVSEVQWNYAYDFSDSLALVWQNGYYGYIGKKGETVIDFVYDEAKSFSGGYAFVKQYGTWKCISTKGETVFEVDPEVAFVHGCASSARILVSDYNGKFGYIDQSGKVVIDMKWVSAADFSEGLAAVSDSSYGRYGYIDEEGSVVISCKYDAAESFLNGTAIVQSGYNSFHLIGKDGERKTVNYNNIYRAGELFRAQSRYGYDWCLIDSDDIMVYPEFFDRITPVTELSEDGERLAYVEGTSSSMYETGRWERQTFLFDAEGRLLPASGMDETGVFAVRANNAWYFTDADGRVIF